VSIALVGDGPLRYSLKDHARARHLGNIHFLGFRNQNQIGDCYAMADVLVLPSGLEPWGLVANEAMCFGLPIIASDRVGAAADLVHHGKNGFVYPFGNISALRECIQCVLSDEPKRAAMGRCSTEIIDNWRPDQAVEGFVRALRSVVRSSRNQLLLN